MSIVYARDQACTSRGAKGTAVEISELDTVFGNTVNVGGLEVLLAIAAQHSASQIIGVNIDDIWFLIAHLLLLNLIASLFSFSGQSINANIRKSCYTITCTDSEKQSESARVLRRSDNHLSLIPVKRSMFFNILED
jgi:hypothetical protein